ncbi:AI-2E family transporter [Nitrosomonas communis]|uniref:AI-2E family transporter n=1 Tax=Nitrosomonas communis TaxID=44574 RepID=UPI003D2B85E3
MGRRYVWFVYQESYGWAIFMILWGTFVNSSIDNFVKPYLISRESKLLLLLIVLGVTGGITAYGFIGIFIGPPILAVGITLIPAMDRTSGNKYKKSSIRSSSLISKSRP